MTRREKPIRRILVPVDFSAESLHALRHAVRLARVFGAETTLLHVVSPTTSLSARGGRAGVRSAAALEEATRFAFDELSRLERRFAGRVGRLRVEVRRGTPEQQIVECAREVEADLIVIGTHGRTGRVAELIGSVAAAVVRMAGRPVMTVPPPSRRGASSRSRVA